MNSPFSETQGISSQEAPIQKDTRQSIWSHFKSARRKHVKRLGKRVTRRIADFQSRQSLVGDTPIIPIHYFPFLQAFADHVDEITSEVQRILRHREAVPTFQEVSIDQKKIATGTNWRTFILFGFGRKAERNCVQAPVTASLLERVPNLQTSWFSILAPGYHIPHHCGVTKGILRAHLGLIIPKQADRCRIRVSNVVVSWQVGEMFVFDDTYDHEVWNDTDEERVVLIIDFDRPMRFLGRLSNRLFIGLLKLTAFYQEPKRKMESFEDRFEAAVQRANKNLESLASK